MQQIIRSSASKINFVVGPMVLVLGVGVAVTAVVLAVVLDSPGFLALFIPAVLALAGGTLIIWMARRSRLEITQEGFTWCGIFAAEQSLQWSHVHQILPPPPGASRIAAVARLRDGSMVEVRALWESPTSPMVLLGRSDHRAECEALIAAHRQWLGYQG